MKIKELTIKVHNLEKQKVFYTKVLNLKLISSFKNEFSIQVGFSIVRFVKSDKEFIYHYCFLIPSNKLDEAVIWLKNRLSIIKIDAKNETQFLESWNAESVYFYDANGNIAEFIVRYDLKNDTDKPFTASQIISVNEIGMPSNNIEFLSNQLEKEINATFWKGDLQRFGTNGSQNGLFLLVNNTIKKKWFPTNKFPEASPFKAKVMVDNKNFSVSFKNEKVVLNCLS